MLTERTDNVRMSGTARMVWADPLIPMHPPSYGWNLVVEPDPADTAMATTADGHTNPFGWVLCRVTPPAPLCLEPLQGQLLGQMLGQRVTVGGTWCDLSTPDRPDVTTIQPLSFIAIDRGITPFVEEHGFTQVLRDVDVLAVADNSPAPLLGLGEAVPHRDESRHIDVTFPFPLKPQTNCNAVFAECQDREPAEAIVYNYSQQGVPSSYPLLSDLQHSYTVESTPNGDVLRVVVDTGQPSVGKGYFYAKFTLTYDEPFDEMCFPDVCLTDPASSCQFTGEFRRTYAWPSLKSARPGDLLLGPASGTGVLGRLLGALQPVQRFDHVVMFVEDDGRTVRHCTAHDGRMAAKEYLSGTVTVKTPFGDTTVKVPLKGIRSDIVRYGWPGAITQTLGEVCRTGRNRSNPRFAYATGYAAMLAGEAASPFALWQLAPAERDKRTAFHDGEATALARSTRDRSKRLWFSIPRLEKNPVDRADIGLLWPRLVKPHPMLDASVRPALQAAAVAAKSIDAHYRFFGYSQSAIALDPAYVGPPAGDPTWRHPGSDWAAGTVAAMCSSFVWAAVQRGNDALTAASRPTIALEIETEPTDDRPRGSRDGLYRYTKDERGDAGQALYDFTHQKVCNEIDAMVDDQSFPTSAAIDMINLGGAVDDVKEYFAAVVANQFCNAFATDDVDNLASTWRNTTDGDAVSPDDTIENWDVAFDPQAMPPWIGVHQVQAYGTNIPVVIGDGGWVMEPLYRVMPVKGTGSVEGAVLMRRPGEDDLTRVAGATVRLGCEATASGPEAVYRFDPHKAGRYHLQASMFVIDPKTNVGQEWASKPQFDIELHDLDRLTGIDLELLPPPGVRRRVTVHHHADVVDRVVFGSDRWGHFDIDDTIVLCFDPREPAGLPADQCNTTLAATSDKTTREVGSGVFVRVKVDARLRSVPGAGGSHFFDGSVVADISLVFYDAGEGETNATVNAKGVILDDNGTFELPYNLVSDDTVPERASGTIVLHNLISVLP